MDREHIIAIRDEISSSNFYTTYRVENGRLIIRATGGVSLEQARLCKEHKDELVWFLATPPDETSHCKRHNGPVVWRVDEYGVWYCSCKWREKRISPPKPDRGDMDIRDYWIKDKG